MRPLLPRLLAVLSLVGAITSALAFAATVSAAERPLRVHFPDGGLAPFIFLPPGAQQPTGIVVDLVTAAAKQDGRAVRYEFLPREKANEALARNHADVALFFQVSRAPAKELRVSAPILSAPAVLVSTREQPLAYRRNSDLRDRPLCVLTDDLHPPLALLAMNGQLIQRKTKTEQAQLMMLRNGDCLAAVMSGPVFAWMKNRYGGDDLAAAAVPLLEESTLLGFRAAESAFADRLDTVLARWRSSGELDRLVSRYLPGGARISQR